MNKDKIVAMRDVHGIQKSDGNWNYNEYMHGMYNGMELMLSIAEDRSPEYKDPPEKWIEGEATNVKRVKASE